MTQDPKCAAKATKRNTGLGETQHGACSIIELANQLEVSDETIRRNIKPLVHQGLIDKGARRHRVEPETGTRTAL